MRAGKPKHDPVKHAHKGHYGALLAVQAGLLTVLRNGVGRLYKHVHSPD